MGYLLPSIWTWCTTLRMEATQYALKGPSLVALYSRPYTQTPFPPLFVADVHTRVDPQPIYTVMFCPGPCEDFAPRSDFIFSYMMKKLHCMDCRDVECVDQWQASYLPPCLPIHRSSQWFCMLLTRWGWHWSSQGGGRQTRRGGKLPTSQACGM